MSAWREEFQRRQAEAEQAVQRFLPKSAALQRTLADASCYSVEAGGKRIRPLLMKAVYDSFGGRERGMEAFMAAMEMIHSSSLVHDDLPCIDNDELRRGRPSVWKKFGFDIAVLAGDNLEIEAFHAAAKSVQEGVDPARAMAALDILARKSATEGMLGGQSVDVELTGKPLSREQLRFIYEKKTGALLEASMMIGCALAGGSREEIEACEKIGSLTGLAFQIRDDILDVTSSEQELGKPIGSDEKNGKTTWVSLYGLQKAETDVDAFSREAVERMRRLRPGDTFLPGLIAALAERKH